MKTFRKTINWIWIGLILLMLAFYFIYPEKFTASHLRQVCGENARVILISYVFLSCIRALLFIPNSVFVIMGIVLYPDKPLLVFFISMIGIIIGSSLVYKAADILKPDHLFKEKYLKKMEGVRLKMSSHGFWIVLFWAFFPVVPTDLICYVAGATRMKYLKFILALIIGEAILVGIYIWTGGALLTL